MTTATEENVVTRLDPVKFEWEEFAADHLHFVDGSRQMATERAIDEAERIRVRPRMEGDTGGPLSPPEAPAESGGDGFAHAYALTAGGYPLLANDAIALKEKSPEFIKALGPFLSGWSTQLFYPPYKMGSSSQMNAVKVPDYYYPVALDKTKMSKGRIELGVIASKDYGESLKGPFRVSDAHGHVGVGTLAATQLTQPSTVMVSTRACVDALAGGSTPVGEMVSVFVRLSLDVSLYEPGPAGLNKYQYSDIATAYSKVIQGNSGFYDVIDAESHILSTEFTVKKPDLSLVVATLTASVTAISTKGDPALDKSIQLPLAFIDAEGYDQSNGGEYYPRAGSVFVSGFSVSARPLN